MGVDARGESPSYDFGRRRRWGPRTDATNLEELQPERLDPGQDAVKRRLVAQLPDEDGHAIPQGCAQLRKGAEQGVTQVALNVDAVVAWVPVHPLSIAGGRMIAHPPDRVTPDTPARVLAPRGSGSIRRPGLLQNRPLQHLRYHHPLRYENPIAMSTGRSSGP